MWPASDLLITKHFCSFGNGMCAVLLVLADRGLPGFLVVSPPAKLLLAPWPPHPPAPAPLHPHRATHPEAETVQ